MDFPKFYKKRQDKKSKRIFLRILKIYNFNNILHFGDIYYKYGSW